MEEALNALGKLVPPSSSQAAHGQNRRAGLRDVGDIVQLRCLGATECQILLGQMNEYFPHLTQQTVGNAAGERPAAKPSLPPRPSTLPFTPREENANESENWLLQHFPSAAFNITRQPFTVMAGQPHHIHLVSDVTPYTCHILAAVPRHWEKVKAELDEERCDSTRPGWRGYRLVRKDGGGGG